METFLTMAGYARYRRVSRFAVSNWKRKGLLTLSAAGLVDVVRSDRALDARPESYRGGRASKRVVAEASAETSVSGNNTLADAILRKETALAKMRELDLAIKENRYVLRQEALEAVQSEYGMVREKLLSIPGKCADRLVGRTRREIFNIIDDEVREALTELSEAPFVEPGGV
jgi:hypothetical protein